MRTPLAAAEHALLSAVFLTAASLKFAAFFVLGKWALLAPHFRSSAFVAILIALDLAVSAAFWTRYRVVGLWTAMVIAVAGNLAFWWGSTQGAEGCGCFGQFLLEGWQHVLVSGIVFVVAYRSERRIHLG